MRTLIGFLAGAVFSLALLARCSVQNANAGGDGPDDGPVSSVDGGGGASSDGGGSVAGSDIGKFIYRSGSRIKARVWQTPDGAREFRSWWDSELELSCTMVFLGSAEPSYCYPKSWGYRAYSDAACTQPVVTCKDTDGERPKFAGGYGDSRIWKVGAKLGEGVVYFNSSGACTAGTATPYCSTGDEVTAAIFARVSEAIVE